MDNRPYQSEIEDAAIGADESTPSRPRVAAKPAAPPKKAKSGLRKLLLIGVPLVAGAGAVALYLAGGRWVSTDNAYVKSDIVAIADDVSGIVAEVDVANNQAVKKGQLLFKLDETPFRLALDAANAQVALAANQLAALKGNLVEAQKQIDQAAADLALAQKTTERQEALAANQFATRAALDLAAHDSAATLARLAAAKAKAGALLAQIAGDPDLPLEKFPQYQNALANAAMAKRNLEHASVLAPADGVLANVDSLRPGNYLAAAQTAMSLVSTDRLWIVANFKETDLTHMRVGEEAEFSIDAYPGRKFHGRVAAFNPATGAEFSVLPAQNTSGNWVKVVQRVPVQLDIERQDDGPELRAGLSVVVDVDTGYQRSLFGAAQAAQK